MHATLPLLVNTDFPALRRGRLDTLQVNLGYLCNQSCLHCHVNAGPRRTEQMDAATVDEVLGFLAAGKLSTLDLTGGAPELNRHFRRLVSAAFDMGVQTVDRCNLTVLEEPGQEDLAAFLARYRVDVVASMPCYLQDNVDRQRGDGVFEASIRGLQQLNALGYGEAGGPALNLMYNPQGPSLPPPQQVLEQDYRNHLWQEYGVRFTQLHVLTNMPIQRFGSTLISHGEFDSYMTLLRQAHRHDNLTGVMCRHLISVDWQGYVYDCDFNQMLGLPLGDAGRPRVHLRDLLGQDLEGRQIVVADHCYGCTAGQGSSCGGALDD